MTCRIRELLLYAVIMFNVEAPKITEASSCSDLLDQTIDTSHASSQEMPMSQEAHKNAKIFICYSSEDEQDTALVRKLVSDLHTKAKFSDDDILFDEKNYPGQGLEIPEFIENIFCTPYVIIIGSASFKEKYVNRKKYAGLIVRREINNILQRRIDRGNKGLIPIWFYGEHRQCFPSCLRDLTAINFTDNYEIQFERLKKSCPLDGSRLALPRQYYLRRSQSENMPWIVPQALPTIPLAGLLTNKRPIAANTTSYQNSPQKRQHVIESPLHQTKSFQHSKTFNSQPSKFVHQTLYHLPDRQSCYYKSSRYQDSSIYLDILKDELDFTPALEIPKLYHKVVLMGMGGTGKTVLAKAFAYQALDAHTYDLIYWLNSTTTHHLEQSFKNLLSTLKVGYDDQASITDLAQLIKYNIMPYHWLLIYDGAPHCRFLDDYIPQAQGHVLITSRCRYGWHTPAVELYPFHCEDAVDYLISFTDVKKSSNNKNQASKIAEKLMYMPLLLHQAANKIRYMKTSFEEFYNDLNSNLNLSLQSLGNPFDKSSTFDYKYLISQTQQQAHQMVNPAIYDLMTCCAYLNHQTISRQYLRHMVLSNTSIQEGFAQLDNFCLIDKGNKFIKMHPGLQYVITSEEMQKDYLNSDDTPIVILLRNFQRYANFFANKHVVKTALQQAEGSEFISWMHPHLTNITHHINILEKQSIHHKKFIDVYKAELNSLYQILNSYTG